MTIRSKIVEPQAAVLVWNYNDRMAQPEGTVDAQEIREEIDLTNHIISIQTSKNKSQAAGSFEITLAPTYNWVNKLTVGSWLVIMMSQGIDLDYKTASQKTTKMLGRIDSVRLHVGVDDTGARGTIYTISGRDWASVFDNTLYIDSLAMDKGASQIGDTISFLDFLSDAAGIKTEGGVSQHMSTTSMIVSLKNFFGARYRENSDRVNKVDGLTLFPEQIFHIPKPVNKFFGSFGDRKTWEKDPDSNRISELIQVKGGVLSGLDKYNETVIDSVGIPQVTSFLGQNNFWQLINEHCNHILNEVIADMRWEDKGQATRCSMTLYKRVRPFVVNSDFIDDLPPESQTTIAPLISKFSNIKRHEIALEDILTIDAGTNWFDKINFIEILHEDAVLGDNAQTMTAQIRAQGQEMDRLAASREGLKPMIYRSRWFPPNPITSSTSDPTDIPLRITDWKFLLKEWYFNTHNMLNGSMVLIGQESYIGVGDNIMVPAGVLGLALNFNMSEHNTSKTVYLLAHVEAIGHAFSVGEDGARAYRTSINFVRGIFTDHVGAPLSSDALTRSVETGAIDQFASDMPESNERSTGVNWTEPHKTKKS